MKLKLELLKIEDFLQVVAWNKEQGADFLYQWSGSGYIYPLTIWQYSKKLEEGFNRTNASNFVYKIMDEDKGKMIGTIELSGVDRERKLATVCRFLIGEEASRGKGYGQEALRLIIEKASLEFDLKMLFLKVFDFNVDGIKCYEKVGFKKIKYEENVYSAKVESWGRYTMVVTF